MRTKYLIFTLLSSLFISSCDYLDFDETNNLKTKEDMYAYFSSAKGMLTHVYSFMPQGCGAFSAGDAATAEELAMRDCASDDAEFGSVSAGIQNMNNGNWSAINTYDTAWDLYKAIRAANSFLAEIADVDYSRFQYDGQYQNWMKQLKYFPYEARVLRAYYFFELARRYGDIAMPLQVLTEDEANSIEKTPFAEAIRFIVSECDAAIQNNNLPDSYANEPGVENGRVTRGFAMAVKSKALLYAASKLHNPSMNVELWKTSAKAALDIIETGLYSLDPQGSTNNSESTEGVLFKLNLENSTFERYNFPLRFTYGGRTGLAIPMTNFPSQNLVDAFETVNGYKVTLENTGWVCEDPEFDPQNPYANRDKRFARTILANGMEFKGSAIETFAGGKDDGTLLEGGSPTGYFLRKYIQESTNFDPSSTATRLRHHWTIYRYAETLLTYAESMINAFGDANYTDDVYKHSALWAINEVRKNADMPEIPSCGKDEFIERLYNEWRVEFAFEDHRFWDIRRWQIGNDTQRELYGVKIRKENGTLSFYKNLCETRTWKDCMYLYPIPQDELFKNTNLNPQNTGW